MFKKFKDKLAEEMKQSPARLQAGMQQLAQAVVSPAPSNSSIQDLSSSYENFSLVEEGDETPRNSPAKHGFQSVDLTSPAPNSMGPSRRSSISSVTSDASSLFPIYESPGNMYHLQSDIEQSASEVEDNISSQLDRVTKDQLYSSYRKVQAKYNKYRGRYTDLARHYRELERENTKAKSVLVETQDKALRRIADLKEQCQLEQQAKAHLEDALRNDIEEKDHLINTLNTKIKLLQTNGAGSETLSSPEAGDQNQNQNHIGEAIDRHLIDLANEPPSERNDNLATENVQLKDKIKKLEAVLAKCKDSMKRNKEKITQLTQDRDILERDFDVLKSTNTERFKVLESDLNGARNEILRLRDQINTLKKREEESVISLAENKLSIHRELEVKEDQIKQLRVELKQVVELKDNLAETVERYRIELEQLKLIHDNQNFDADKNDLIQDLSKGKSEALKLMQQEMQQKLIDLEENMGMKYHQEVERNKDLLEKLEKLEKAVPPDGATESSESTTIVEQLKLDLEEKDSKLKVLEGKLNEADKSSESHKIERDRLETELTDIKTRLTDLNNEYSAQKIIFEEQRKDVNALNATLKDTNTSQYADLEKFKRDLSESEQNCEQLRQRIQEYTVAFEKAKQKLIQQDNEIKSLREKIQDNDEANKLQDELENKEVELLGLRSELKSCKTTINDLREKLQCESSRMKELGKEKACLIANILDYKKTIGTLKEDCCFIKSNVNKNVLEQINLCSMLNQKVQDTIANEVQAARSIGQTVVQQLETKDEESDAQTIKQKELLIEIESLKNQVAELEPLRESNVDLAHQIEQLHRNLRDCDVTFAKHKELESELIKLKGNFEDLAKEKNVLESTNKRMAEERHRLEKELTGLLSQVSDMKEKVNKFDDISLKNKSLMAEIDGLNFKLYDIGEMQDENRSLKYEIDDLREKQKALDDLADKNQQLSKEIIALTEQLTGSEGLSQEAYNLKTELGNLTNELVKKNTEVESLMAKCGEKEHNVEDVTRKYEEQSRLRNELAEKCGKLEADYQDLYEKYEGQMTELKEFEKKCLAHSSEIEDLRKKESELSKQLQDTMRVKNETIKKFKEFKAQRTKMIQEKTDELEELRSKNTEILKELETSENIKNESLKLKLDEIATLTERNTELTKEIDHLKAENQEMEALRNNNSFILSELEELKATNRTINLENKELKEKQNELLKSNAELQRSEEVFHGKLAELENDAVQLQNEIDTLRKESESSRAELASRDSELNKQIDHLREQLNESNSIRSRHTEQLIGENESLRLSESEASAALAEAVKKNAELEGEVSKLREKIKELLHEMEQVRSRVAELESTEITNGDLNREVENLRSQIIVLETVQSENNDLKTKLGNLAPKIVALEAAESENMKLTTEITQLKAEMESFVSRESISSELSLELSNLEAKNMDLSSEMESMKVLLDEKVAELKSSSTSSEDKNKEIKELRNKTENLEKKFNDRQQEIDLLKATNGELREQLQNVNDCKTADETLARNNNRLNEERKELEAQLDEALLTFQAKESQMQIVNGELKDQADKLKDQLKNSEEEQTMRLKQLVKEFQAQLHDKDEEIQAALEKRFDRQQNYESELIRQYKEQLKDFQVELTAKSEQIETLILENKRSNSQKDDEIAKLAETIARNKNDHDNELREVEKKWKSLVKQRTDQLEAKHGDEVNELTKEWHNERRTVANSDTPPEELESTSRVAMAAVQSNTGSLHSLQQTLVSQRRELSELRKVLKMRSDTLEDSTEIEYLRNILFEYMMGRETVVLARVIAAVVKFDQEQTSKILKKEEDKLTLLGSLGLS